jgi:DNA-binding transcriptional regulator PaaX
LLKGPKGADVPTLSQKFGWQKHTTRAALTGLRKAGFTIERIENEGGRAASYRITAQPADAPAQ